VRPDPVVSRNPWSLTLRRQDLADPGSVMSRIPWNLTPRGQGPRGVWICDVKKPMSLTLQCANNMVNFKANAKIHILGRHIGAYGQFFVNLKSWEIVSVWTRRTIIPVRSTRLLFINNKKCTMAIHVIIREAGKREHRKNSYSEK
jgi:hypothetical protein